MSDLIRVKEVLPTDSKFKAWLYKFTRKIAPIECLKHVEDGIGLQVKPKYIPLSDQIEWMVLRKLAELELHKHELRNMGSPAYNREFGSIHIDCGRRGGHTTAARALFKQFWANSYKVHAFFPNLVMMRHFWSCRELKGIFRSITPLDSMILHRVGQIHGLDLDGAIVIFDVASRLDKPLVEDFLDLSRARLHIFLE